MTRTTPGLVVDGIPIPLEHDPYFLLTLAHPNSFIVNSVGFLSPGGRGSAKLVLPPGLPLALTGSVFHHAFVTIDLQRNKVAFGSNPAPLILVR